MLLLLHGYGSNEHDLAGLAGWLPEGMPWASLRAPLDMGYGAAAWFPLTLPEDPDAAAVDTATELLWAWIDTHVSLDAEIVPVGFSQGGFMALQLLRTRPDRVAATAVIAGFTASNPQPGDAALADARPEVFWARGDADAVVPEAAIAQLDTWLATHSTARKRVYSGLGHAIDADVMQDVRGYLADALRPT